MIIEDVELKSKKYQEKFFLVGKGKAMKHS